MSKLVPAEQELFPKLEARGWQARMVSTRHLPELQEEIEGKQRQGLFDPAFYQEWLSAFSFSLPDGLPGAASLIVVSVPQSQIRFIFTWNGKLIPLKVPPTYLHGNSTDKQVEELLAETLGASGYRVAPAALPKKLLAVRSGLGAYGKNNICYVEGMGSFHRLAAFYSDLPCVQDTWQEARMMEKCTQCSACLRNCPTGAITDERFLLHAERCITFHNEKATDIPFPAWLDPAWHNCLVGCMRCQKVCPANKTCLKWVEDGSKFSQAETLLLLQGVELGQLSSATRRKLELSDLAGLLNVLPRNLGVFLYGGWPAA
jgi:epoxyqueuosine reductase